jgi:WXXGXW repeat (2 copies)
MKRSITTILALAAVGVFSSQAFAGAVISVRIAPPPLPVFEQPVCPGPGYIWTPGYHAYGEFGYYWVPGAWVLAPQPGFLWTPGYWGWNERAYFWHTGYWGRRVGFYGGINYGFGYFGTGFAGGRWAGNVFHYNTAVTNVNVTNVHNTYIDKTVVRNVTNNTTVNHSFNGPGGVSARADRREVAESHASRQGPTPAQISHAEAMHANHVTSHGGVVRGQETRASGGHRERR